MFENSKDKNPEMWKQELELKERELEIRRRELELKEKELQLKIEKGKRFSNALRTGVSKVGKRFSNAVSTGVSKVCRFVLLLFKWAVVLGLPCLISACLSVVLSNFIRLSDGDMLEVGIIFYFLIGIQITFFLRNKLID